MFASKDLGTLLFFSVSRSLNDTDYVYLFHRKCIGDLLSKVPLLEYKGIDTPMST